MENKVCLKNALFLYTVGKTKNRAHFTIQASYALIMLTFLSLSSFLNICSPGTRGGTLI